MSTNLKIFFFIVNIFFLNLKLLAAYVARRLPLQTHMARNFVAALCKVQAATNGQGV